MIRLFGQEKADLLYKKFSYQLIAEFLFCSFEMIKICLFFMVFSMSDCHFHNRVYIKEER